MNHQLYIDRCHELAARGQGRVGNGALVGAVLVHNEEVIAEGWHAAYGEVHAERHLLESVIPSSSRNEQKISSSLDDARDDSGKLREDIALYVNLEPCSHHGKTPPCTDIIIDSGVKTVVFGMKDPDKRVQGRGVGQLKTAGINVIGPVDTVGCRRFNRGYVSVREQGRPFVTLKSARTKDGKIANEDGSPLKITSQEQDEWSHEYLRAKHDAILVGVQTVLNDDPQLTVRLNKKSIQEEWQPRAIILDPSLRVPNDANIVRDGTILVTASEDEETIDGLMEKGVRVIRLPVTDGEFDLTALMQILATPYEDYIGLTSILVEGGQRTWDSFKKQQLVDEEIVLIGRG